MSIIRNARDLLMQAAPSRYSNPPNAAILLSASTPVFHIAAGGAHDPATITFTASLIELADPVTFVGTGCTLSVVGNVATLAYADMAGDTATVKATLTENGQSYESNLCNITKISDGSASTLYTWVKYGTSAVGAGLTDDPAGMAYIGLAYNKVSPVESTTPGDYAWSLLRGTDGEAVKGDPGVDGQTFYTWIKYADVADGTGLYDTPTDSTLYLGLAVNKTTATESTVKTDYVWSKFRGAQGVPGESITGPTGARGAGHFYTVGNPWSDALANGATPGDNVVDDVVTVSAADGTYALTKKWNGSAWLASGQVIDGSLLVTGSVSAAKIDAKGLTIRTPAGAIILDAGGGGLQTGYEAPGTKNSDQTLGALGYTGDLNATKDISLIGGGSGITISGNSIRRASGGAWDAGGYSKNQHAGGAMCAFIPSGVVPTHFMAGLNDDPSTDFGFNGIKYAWHGTASSNDLYIWENGAWADASAVITTYVKGVDVLSVVNDGSTVTYRKNGVPFRAIAATPGEVLGFDCSIYTGEIDNIQFQPMTSLADAFADATAKANAAQAAAISTADTAAQAKADLAKTQAQAYADGIVTAEEARAIADATTKANNAKAAAEAAAALDATAKANVAATTANWAGGLVGRPTDTQLLNNQDGIITRPIGGLRISTTAPELGAIRVKLPVFFTDTMVRFSVDIYEYSAGLSCTLDIAGYLGSGGSSWTHVTARVVGGSNVEYPVYFGHDGSKACIWIDNPATGSWVYPQIRVRDVLVGYSNYTAAAWESGWEITISSAAVTNQSTSVLDTYPAADWTKVVGTGRPANNATVGAPPGTMVGNNLAETVEGWAYNGLLALNAVNDATNGLDAKLRKNGDDILGGVLAVNTVSVPVGLRVGNITWNASGARTGGYGVAITPAGLLGSNTQGVVTFAINASTGDATFGGTLTAPTGSFGAVTIAAGGSLSSGQTAFHTGNGYHLSFAGGVAKFSVGNSAGAYMYYDGSQLRISGVTYDAFTLSVPDIDNWGGAGVRYFSITATPSGGKAPLKYQWTFTSDPSETGISIQSGSTSQTLNLACINKTAGSIASGVAVCNVIDADGRIAIDSGSIVQNY